MSSYNDALLDKMGHEIAELRTSLAIAKALLLEVADRLEQEEKEDEYFKSPLACDWIKRARSAVSGTGNEQIVAVNEDAY